MTVAPDSWKAVVRDVAGAAPPVRGRTPRVRVTAASRRPTTIHPTRGAPRKTSDWDKVLASFGARSGGIDPGYNWKAVEAAGRQDPRPSAPKDDGGFSIGGFLSNIGGDLKDIAFGLPGGIALGVRQAGAIAAAPFMLAPGGLGQAARNFERDTYNELWGAGKAVAGDIKHRWWDNVAHGNFRPLYDDPLISALDVASVASAGQLAPIKAAAASRALGAARVAKVAQDARVVKAAKGVRLGPQKPVKGVEGKAVEIQSPYPGNGGNTVTARVTPAAGRIGKSSWLDGPRDAAVRPAWLRQVVEGVGDPALSRRLESGGKLASSFPRVAAQTGMAARYRPPIQLDEQDFINLVNKDGAITKSGAEIKLPPKGPYSTPGLDYKRRPAPLTPGGRAVQAPFLKAGEKLRDPGERLSKVPGIEPLSGRLKERLYRKHARQIADEGQQAGTELLHEAGVRVGIGKIRKILHDPEAGAAFIGHAQGTFTAREINGVLETPLQIRERVIETATRNFEEHKKLNIKNEAAWKENERQLELLRKIPDELITLEGNSKRVTKLREAVDAAREIGPKLVDSATDVSGLSKVKWRDVEKERRTLSQRVLLGGAKHVDDAGPDGRVVVPEVHDRFKDEHGVEYVSGESVAATLRGAIDSAHNGPGHYAQQWLRTHQPQQIKRILEIENPLERERAAFKLYDNLANGRLRTRDGEHARPGEMIDAQEVVKRANNYGEEVKYARTHKETLWRVRGPRGATHWVPSDAGSPNRPPSALTRRGDLKPDERYERVDVPSAVAQKYQSPGSGLIQGLPPGHLAVNNVSHVPRNGGTGRYALDVSGVGVRRVVGPKTPKGAPRPYGLAPSLREGGLLPEAKAAIHEKLAPKRELAPDGETVITVDPEVNKLAREILENPDFKLTKDSRFPTRETDEGDLALWVIDRAANKRMLNKIPLDKDGNIEWEVLTKKIVEDPFLRRLFNSPEYLSKVPVDEGAVYVKHTAVDAPGQKSAVDKANEIGQPPVGPVDPVQKTQASLASRYGENFDPKTLLATWDNISKSYGNKQFFEGFLNTFAAKTTEGGIRSFDAHEASRLDPKKWATIPVNQVQNIEHAIESWNPQMGSTIPFDGKISFRPDKLDLKGGDVYVVPRAAGTEIQWAFKNPHWVLQKYDSFLQAWRAGILALAPRWLINNYAGNSLFLGLFTGGDLSALRAAKGSRDLLPHEIEGNTFSGQAHFDPTESLISKNDLGQTKKLSRRYFRVTEGVFRVNAGVEGGFRRAAYIHAVKTLLNREGLGVRTRGLGLTPEEKASRMVEAVAQAPDYIKREGMRNMKQWMGDYQGLTQFERQVMRRVIPFYSWIRVINTWVFGMPFRSPLRAEALSLISQLGRAAQGDRSYLPWWEQGRIELPGGFSLRTSGINPLASVMETVSAVTGNEEAGLWDRVAMGVRAQGGGLTPPLAALGGMLYGRQAFGNRPYTAPPGYGGTVTPFGGEPQYVNSVTGQIESRATPGNPMEEIAQMLPFVPLIRDALSFDQRPYDSASTLDLLRNRLLGQGDPNQLYQPEPSNGGSGRNKIPVLSGVSSVLGAPIYKNNKQQEKAKNWAREVKFLKDQRAQWRLQGRQALQRYGIPSGVPPSRGNG